MTKLNTADALYVGSSAASKAYLGSTEVWSAAGASYAVGSFTAPTATGTQAVTGVGFTPKAILFWTSGGRSASGIWRNDIFQSIGMTSGASESYAVAGASQDGQSTSNTGRRIAAKTLMLIAANGSGVYAEADLQSFDADGFTLDWTTASSVDPYVMFLAIGGDAVSAKVVNWTSPTSTGNKAVTGVGFTPDVVLHATNGEATSVPDSQENYLFSFGGMDAAGNQWAQALRSKDALGTSETERYQRTNICYATIREGVAGTLHEVAEFSSMDADGFTLDFTTASVVAAQNISLALSGIDAKVGNFTSPTSATTKAITGAGFEPEALLLTGVGNTASTSVAANANWGMGAADGTNERTVAQTDVDSVATTKADSLWKNDKAIAVASSASVTEEADLDSFDADGFTLDFTTATASAVEYLYLALGG